MARTSPARGSCTSATPAPARKWPRRKHPRRTERSASLENVVSEFCALKESCLGRTIVPFSRSKGTSGFERGSRAMSNDVSTFRLYLMRFLYLLNFVLLGLDVWPAIINHVGAWDPVRGVAFSFWAALSALSALGLRYPLKMLPLLLLQLLYKSVWLTAVALPLWPVIRSTDLAK